MRLWYVRYVNTLPLSESGRGGDEHSAVKWTSLIYIVSQSSTYSSSPSDAAASSISIGINLPLDGCPGVFFFFLLTLFRITLAKSLMSSFCVDCGNLETNCKYCHNLSTSRVSSIIVIWTEFWKYMHVSFEHRQRDFRVPAEISLVYWRYKTINFPLHYSIKYFKNNNCSPSISFIYLFFSVNASFRKDFQRNLQDSIQMPDITKRNCIYSFFSRKHKRESHVRRLP